MRKKEERKEGTWNLRYDKKNIWMIKRGKEERKGNLRNEIIYLFLFIHIFKRQTFDKKEEKKEIGI